MGYHLDIFGLPEHRSFVVIQYRVERVLPFTRWHPHLFYTDSVLNEKFSRIDYRHRIDSRNRVISIIEIVSTIDISGISINSMISIVNRINLIFSSIDVARKRRLLSAGVVQRPKPERQTRRVMFGTVAGWQNPEPGRPGKKTWDR